jgi:hypothetical protein
MSTYSPSLRIELITTGDQAGTWGNTTNTNLGTLIESSIAGYVIYNASSYTATIYNSTVTGNTTAAGVGVAIPAGKTVTVWTEGTNFAFQNNHLSSLTLATDLAVADGGTGASSFTSGGILRGNGASALSVASAADIVAAIGATAVTNATNATNVGQRDRIRNAVR